MMKNTTICARCLRQALARSSEWISTMQAAVVPIQPAAAAPSARTRTFLSGVPTCGPLSLMPPPIVYSANNSAMNGTYSSIATYMSSCSATRGPKTMKAGIKKAAAQNAEILPKWSCQKRGMRSGRSAIDSRIPAKGIPQASDISAPGSSG